MKKILIIAGSDPCGGAGLQADIKVATKFKVYAGAVPTCLTAQNTTGVSEIYHLPVDFIEKQIEFLFDDIAFDAIKIGMLGNKQIADCVLNLLLKHDRFSKTPIILDPVMIATSGDSLLHADAILSIKKLITISHIVTPNIDEAQSLSGVKITNQKDLLLAAKNILSLGCRFLLIKGGHLDSGKRIVNYLFKNQNNELASPHLLTITNSKIFGPNFHGTGCALSTAIAANIAKGLETHKAVQIANRYVYKAIINGLAIGNGSSILCHY